MIRGGRTSRFPMFRTGRARIRSKPWWTFVATVCAVVVALACVVIRMSAPQASGAPSMRFGVLGSTCDPARVSALSAAGVRLAEVRVQWAEFEPSPGIYNADYLSRLTDAIGRCRDAGLGVVLTPGIQYAPSWVADLPAGAYRDQQGHKGPENVPNIIFSPAVRQAFADYIAKLNTVLPLNTFSVIRVGTSEAGEVGYPSGDIGKSGSHFWAYDSAAQTGKGLPAGVSSSPLPGWAPGSAKWHGKSLTTAQVQGWFSWYTRSASRAILWQIELFRGYGYSGQFHLPLAGRGVLPSDLKAAVAAHLDGTGDRDGSLERGLSYPEQLVDIAKHSAAPGNVLADVTGVDDASAVEARQRQLPPFRNRASPHEAVDATIDGADLTMKRCCDPRKSRERIPPLLLRKRSCVSLRTLDDHLKGLLALDAGDDTECETEGKNLGPEPRHLLIMVIAGHESTCPEVEEQQSQSHGQLGKEVVERHRDGKLKPIVEQCAFHSSLPLLEIAPCYGCDSPTPGRFGFCRPQLQPIPSSAHPHNTIASLPLVQ